MQLNRLFQRPVRFSNVDRQCFVNSIGDVNIDVNDTYTIYSLVGMLFNEFYIRAVRSQICDQVADVRDSHLCKWERLLQDKDVW